MRRENSADHAPADGHATGEAVCQQPRDDRKIDSSFGRARLIIELRNSFDITVAQPVGPDMLFHDRTIINVEGALRAVGSNSGAFVVTPGDYTLVLIIQIFVEGCTDNRSFFQEGSLEVIGVGV